MTPPARVHACAGSLLGLALLVAGCARQEPAAQTHATAADRAACAQHADDVYRMRNPDVIYRQDTYDTSTRDVPFSGAGLSSLPTRGLSGEFERDQLLRRCLKGGGGTAPDAPTPQDASTAAPPAPSPAPAAAAQP